jgi:hypothetical protein
VYNAGFSIVEFKSNRCNIGRNTIRANMHTRPKMILIFGLRHPKTERAPAIESKPNRLQQGRLPGTILSAEQNDGTSARGDKVEHMAPSIESEIFQLDRS